MRVPVVLRALQLPFSVFVAGTLAAVTVVNFCMCGSYNYPHIPAERVHSGLFRQRSPQLPLSPAKPDCDYRRVLESDESLAAWQVPARFDDFSADGLVNGSFAPRDCNAQISVALLVTYRNRQEQLDIFLPYMHNFLRKQNIHYKIFVIEQQDEKPFNKGLLYNTGARQAMAEGFPCLVLHDVDLLPLDAANLYACLRQPRHMSASLDKFRFVLTYEWLVGGALAIQSDHFAGVNGFSHRFEGWGGEDDDFFERIHTNDLSVIRLPPAMSRYTMLVHAPERANAARARVLRENRRANVARARDGRDQRDRRDGLAALTAAAPARARAHRLCTMLRVST